MDPLALKEKRLTLSNTMYKSSGGKDDKASSDDVDRGPAGACSLVRLPLLASALRAVVLGAVFCFDARASRSLSLLDNPGDDWTRGMS